MNGSPMFHAPRREVDDHLGMHVDRTGDNHPGRGQEHPDPQHQHQSRDVLNLAIQRHDGNRGDTGRQKLHLPRVQKQTRPKKSSVLSHADAAGGNFKRAAEHELPHENPRHHVAPTAPTETFPQECIRSAGGRNRST
jgi:hypothetical protein